MAQKKSTTKKVQKKKTPAKSTARGGKSSTQAKSAPAPQQRDPQWRPLSVLLIMGLVTVIVVMLNRNYSVKSFFPQKKLSFEPVTEKEPEQKPRDEKADKKEKIEDEKRIKKEEPKSDRKKVKLYFIKLDYKTEKYYLSTVTRNVDSSSLLKNTLNELVRGPSSSEEKKGYLSAVPGQLKIRNVKILKRTAVIDVDSSIEYNAQGNIIIHRLDQIVYTATQFDSIDNVQLLINGRARKTLGSDGLSIGGTLHRRGGQ